MSTAHTSGQNLDRWRRWRPHWRKTTWAMIVWTLLIAFIMIAGGLNISHKCAIGQKHGSACHYAAGEALLFVIGVLVFVILALVRALTSRDR